jgi:hypothetical protein
LQPAPGVEDSQPDVRFGSKGDIPAPLAHFRFPPESRHRPFMSTRPKTTSLEKRVDPHCRYLGSTEAAVGFSSTKGTYQMTTKETAVEIMTCSRSASPQAADALVLFEATTSSEGQTVH